MTTRRPRARALRVAASIAPLLGALLATSALAAPPAASPAKVPAEKSAPPGMTPPPAAPRPPIRVPELAFEKYVLPNGLEVILHVDRRTPTVAVNLWYHVASKDEPPRRNGFAHLFEHLMFQGSRNVGEDKFFAYLEQAGASERNGTTNADRTNYFETVPSNQLPLVLWLESDRMGWLLDHVGEKTFAEQREVVKNERRQNYENAPYGLVIQYIRAALYPPGHPYHLLTIGTPEDLDSAALEDVKNFYRRFYVPNNATLVIAGDIDVAKAKALTEKYFGTLKRGADPGSLTKPMPVALQAEKRLAVEADVELGRIVVDWPTPPHYAKGDGDLDLLSQVLSGGRSSRLHKRLVYDLQIAQSVWASQASSMLSSQFEIGVALRKGADPQKALAVVDEELDRLRATPPTAEEMERARTSILTDLVFETESLTGRANQLNEYNQRTGDPGYLSRDVARFRDATAVDVQRAVTSYLPRDRRIVTVVTPTPGAPRAGRLVQGGAK